MLQRQKLKNNAQNDLSTEKTSNPNIIEFDISKATQQDIEKLRHKVYLKRLELTGNNKAKAARELGINGSKLKRELKKDKK